MNKVVGASITTQRFTTALMSIFAGLALLLTAIGLYGVLSYLVSNRTKEIGVRIALGAQRADVLKMVLGQGMWWAFLGVALGLLAALALTRLMAHMLFEVSATEPVSFIFVSLLLLTVAILACYIPARRAMRVDPMTALRYE
jgi:putative ABC transport system permease protein